MAISMKDAMRAVAKDIKYSGGYLQCYTTTDRQQVYPLPGGEIAENEKRAKQWVKRFEFKYGGKKHV